MSLNTLNRGLQVADDKKIASGFDHAVRTSDNTFTIFFKDGSSVNLTIPLPADGEKGDPGASIESAEFNDEGKLVITLTDGTVLDPVDVPKSDIDISKDPGNVLEKKEDGLYVPSTAVSISKADNNILENKDDGLYAEKTDLSNYYDKAEVDDIVDDIQLYKFPNAVIHGDPTINNGQISDFSSSDYLAFPFLVDFGDRDFTIDMAFTTGEDVTNQQNIIDGRFGLALAIQNGHFVLAISSDGQSWNIGVTEGTYQVEPNTNYYLKLNFNKLQYKLSYSLDKVTYVADIIKVATQRPYPVQIYIGIGDLNTANPKPFKGIIDMNHSSLYVNSLLVWQGMDDVGLAARLSTDLENIDDVGVERIKKIAETEGLKSSQGRNLITYPYYNQDLTYRGIEYTVNNDGSVNCNGTATGGIANFVFFDNRTSNVPNLIKKDVEYTLSSTNQIPKRVNFAIRTYDSSKAVLEQFTVTNDLNNVKVKLTKDFVYSTMYIAIGDGVTVDNLVIYPMLEEGSSVHSYEPTTESNVSILSQEKLSQGRNLLPYPYTKPSGYTLAGIEYIVNNDGSVTATRKTENTSISVFSLTDSRITTPPTYTLKNGKYVISGCPTNNYGTNVRLDVGYSKEDGGYAVYAISTNGNPSQFEVTDITKDKQIDIRIQIINGALNVGESITFYPQLEEGTVAHAYEPTTESNVTLAKRDDYSTTETIVGHWIDGKPIYRRTYELTDPTVFQKDVAFKVADLPSGFDVLVKGFGTIKTYEGSYSNSDILIYSTANAIMAKQNFTGYPEKMWVTVEYTRG